MSGGRIPAPVYGLCVAALLAMIAAALLSLQNEPLQLAPVASGRGCKALGALLIYLALTALLLWRRRRQQAWQSRGALSDAERVWIVDASQTGTATELADQAAGMLAGGGTAVQRQALGELDGASLQQARRMLLVLSTTGEGDGPDSALRFLRVTRQMVWESGTHGMGVRVSVLLPRPSTGLNPA